MGRNDGGEVVKSKEKPKPMRIRLELIRMD